MGGKKKSDFKTAIREQAARKVKGSKHNPSTQKEYRETVEKGRKDLLASSSEGGDPRGKKIRGELEYLLNNYLPQYDIRIEQLINEWRTSGDPSYDPQIRMRFRRARRDHMNKATPL